MERYTNLCTFRRKKRKSPTKLFWGFLFKKYPKKIRGFWEGLKFIASHYREIYRNTSLVKSGLKRAQKYNKNVKVIFGGGAVSFFYEQLGNLLPKGTVISVWEGENLIEKIIRNDSIEEERCYFAWQKPRNKLIFEQLLGTIKTACNYIYKSHMARIRLVYRGWRLLYWCSNKAKLPS